MKSEEFKRKWDKKKKELVDKYGDCIPIKYLLELEIDAIEALLEARETSRYLRNRAVESTREH